MPPSKQKLHPSPPFTCFSGNHIFRLPVADTARAKRVVLYHSPQHMTEFELPTVMLHSVSGEKIRLEKEEEL